MRRGASGRLARTRAPSIALLLLLGCRGDAPQRDAPQRDAGAAGGTVVVAQSAEPDLLLPPLVASVEGKKVVDLLFDRLAEIGPALNTVGDAGFRPQLAARWAWAPDSLSIAFHLNPAARWHDGVPVRAADVRFTHALYADPATGSPVASEVADVDSVTAPDSLTAVFWFRRRFPEQFFQAAYQMHILPAHLLGREPRAALLTSALARAPVGSGRFRFVRWVPAQTLELVADTAHYRGRPRLDRVLFSVAPDYTATTAKLFAGEADFFEAVRAEQLPEVARHPTLRALQYPALDLGFLQFNLRDPAARARPHPVFGDRAVRRALAMALDRERLVRSALDSLGVVALGPVLRAQASADTAIPQLPYDPAAARAALDAAGWRDADGDGVRERNGRPLAFTLIVPSSSRNRVRYAVLVQEQLRQAGARVRLEQMEFNTYVDRLSRRAFDASLSGYRTDPSPATVRQMWGSGAARARGGSNYSSYESPAFDAALDSAVSATDPARSRAYYRQAYATIVADAPAVWLYELRPIAAAHRRLRITGMRADAWWAGMADWSIPPAERIARDRIGLRAAAR
jgi:peptide/nickel transport system substrate-binding protein